MNMTDTQITRTEEAIILTPPPGPAPRINGAKVYGCHPGHPFLYRIPCTGIRPMKFSIDALPAGLMLDARTGIIRGTAPDEGSYKLLISACNEDGECSRTFTIISGDALSLTPPMGFNNWYATHKAVTDAYMRSVADTVIKNGMADFGYDYVNVDDCWMGERDLEGNISGNEKFPDMKAMADYIHSLGLKAGIYSSPGPTTCGGSMGSYQYEAQDARKFAEWGYDFVKYDLCSYHSMIGEHPAVEDLIKPYKLMGDLLREQKRDILYNLCEYGMGDVWDWGLAVGAHSWRTGGDLGFELNRFFEIALRNCELGANHGPGGWNDPDYIQIGYLDQKGASMPAPFTPTESYSFMALWALMAAPLFYSGDMTRLDDFTLNILCNSEVIDVNQDTLGHCATLIGEAGETFVLAKALEDGSLAVGLCNRGEQEAILRADWKALGLDGAHIVRDIWRQHDLGRYRETYKTSVPPRGVAFLRIRRA